MITELMPGELRIHMASASMEGIYVYVPRDVQNAMEKLDQAWLKITYPLRTSATFEVPGWKKMARGGCITELIQFVIDSYKKIYEEEEKTQTVPTPPISDRTGLINRPQSDGSYGIWGHDLEDLLLWGITLDTDTGEITLGIDS